MNLHPCRCWSHWHTGSDLPNEASVLSDMISWSSLFILWNFTTSVNLITVWFYLEYLQFMKERDYMFGLSLQILESRTMTYLYNSQ